MDKDSFIDFMVKSGVIKFGNFKTKSGRMSPYFINMGLYSTGSQMRQLGRFYAGFINELISSSKLPDSNFTIFGPAYKGIPLAVATSIALMRDFGIDISWCFNRKEKKDHGEGGNMVGCELKDGDSVLIVDDVLTAGTAVRESLTILREQADLKISGVIVAVDRMERGRNGEKSALKEISNEFNVDVFPIVNIKEIVDSLYDRNANGRPLIDPEVKASIDAYLKEYGTYHKTS